MQRDSQENEHQRVNDKCEKSLYIILYTHLREDKGQMLINKRNTLAGCKSLHCLSPHFTVCCLCRHIYVFSIARTFRVFTASYFFPSSFCLSFNIFH